MLFFRSRTALFITVSYLLAVANVAAASRPNVILILADDLGYECVGANGNTSYQTPNLDRLAAGGVRFERCYAQPLCTPTRVQLMTGQYNVRNYVDFGQMDPSLKTFGNLFKDAGYATCIAGKWQLGRQSDLPAKFGFDESCLWQHLRLRPRYANPGLEINGVEKDFSNGEYGPDIINDYVIDFIGRQKDQPFFVYYPLTLTHDPYLATPDSKDWNPALKVERKSRDPQHFADMVAYMDKLIGKLVAHLDAQGLRENTLILFLGDNGTGTGTISRVGDREVVGAKGKPYETGMRVPLIANWPKSISSGKVVADLVDTTDFLPTIAEAANVAVPTDRQIDGRSFLPQLRGERGAPREWIYSWYAPRGVLKHEFAANLRWKLYRTGAFFDIASDPLEQRPLDLSALSGDAADGAAKLREVLEKFKDARPAHLVNARKNNTGSGEDLN
jgi:arylsulfatase A